jgi:DNA-binding response OmpR family regulator
MIFLVEDDPNDVFLMERAMKKGNLTIPMRHAKNGRDAIEYLDTAGRQTDPKAYPIPSVIFLDLKLPFVHGFDVLRWIKQESAISTVPVIILSSSLELEDRKKARELGAEKFLVKPPTTEGLTETLREFSVSN